MEQYSKRGVPEETQPIIRGCEPHQSPDLIDPYVAPAIRHLARYGIPPEQTCGRVLFVDPPVANGHGLDQETAGVYDPVSGCVLVQDDRRRRYPDPFVVRIIIHELVHAYLSKVYKPDDDYSSTESTFLPPLLREGVAENIALRHTIPYSLATILMGLIENYEQLTYRLSYIPHGTRQIILCTISNLLTGDSQLGDLNTSYDPGISSIYSESKAVAESLSQRITGQFSDARLREYISEMIEVAVYCMLRDPNPTDSKNIHLPLVYWYITRQNGLNLPTPAYAAYALEILAERKCPGILADLLKGPRNGMKYRIGPKLYDSLAQLLFRREFPNSHPNNTKTHQTETYQTITNSNNRSRPDIASPCNSFSFRLKFKSSPVHIN